MPWMIPGIGACGELNEVDQRGEDVGGFGPDDVIVQRLLELLDLLGINLGQPQMVSPGRSEVSGF